MAGITAEQVRNGPTRFTSTTRRHWPAGSSQVGALPPVMPALLTRTSIVPCRASVAWVAARTAASSVSSTRWVLTRSPMAPAAAAIAAWSMSQIATAAPEASMRSAIARPMPRAPPVTTAVRPCMSSWFIADPCWLLRACPAPKSAPGGGQPPAACRAADARVPRLCRSFPSVTCSTRECLDATPPPHLRGFRVTLDGNARKPAGPSPG